MINLLPPEQKEENLFRERLNLILILGTLFLSFLISLSLILFSIKISIWGNLKVQELFIEAKEKEISLSQDLEEKIKNSNQSLSNLDYFYQNQLEITEILEKIAEILPPEAYLTSFNLNPLTQKEEGRVQISLSGFCPKREILLSFRESLEKEEGFSKIYFPPENWVSPSNINFSTAFILK
jgi:Tfp pilus assembly protein PilN